MSALALDPVTKSRVEAFLAGDYDAASKAELRRMLENDPKGVIDAFYSDLDFGTGGMRGLMGIGTARLNTYTIRAATYGLARYLTRIFKDTNVNVVIGYDSRHRSREFALEAARVLAAASIRALCFEELRPTPLVSFACRHTHAQAAIMITASHNPPEYNGYKVYWDDGGQVLPPHDKGIIDCVRAVKDPDQIPVAPPDDPYIQKLGTEIDEAYLAANRPLASFPQQNKEKGKLLKIIFTPLHGTGGTIIPKALADFGFTNCLSVPEQKEPDGNFPTCKTPNPEEKDALAMAIALAKKEKADLVLATDPDADRMGLALFDGTLLTGNQIASIALDHLLRSEKKWPKNGAIIKSFVTTELLSVIASAHGFETVNVPVGFKYFAEKIRQWDNEKKQRFIFGGEESYGYLLGTHVRDKDAVIACCLIAEVALDAKLHKQTLFDRLLDIYKRYGIFREGLRSVSFGAGKEGMDAMSAVMERLRTSPPTHFADVFIVASTDFQTAPPTWAPPSNVLRYELADSSWLVIRPSGTEPKIKLYCGVRGQKTVAEADKHAATLLSALNSYLSIR